MLPPGASSGFGEAIAWRLAEAGCKLIITARRLDRLQQLQQQLVEKYQVGSSSSDLAAVPDLLIAVAAIVAAMRTLQLCSRFLLVKHSHARCMPHIHTGDMTTLRAALVAAPLHVSAVAADRWLCMWHSWTCGTWMQWHSCQHACQKSSKRC